MNEQKIKHIHLDFEGEEPEALLNLLQELSLEIVTAEQSELIITDKIIENCDSKKILCLSSKISKAVIYSKKNYSLMSLTLLNYSIGITLLKRFLGVSSSLSLDRVGIDGDVKFLNFKLSDSKSFGHYSDVLASEGMKNGFNSFNIRGYFFKKIECLELLKESELVMFPLEVDFMVSEKLFVIQSHISIKNLSFENLRNEDHIGEVFKDMVMQPDIADVYTLESGSKLVFFSVWFKEEMSPSFLMSEFSDFKKMEYNRYSGQIASELKMISSDTQNENSFGFDYKRIEEEKRKERVKLDRIAAFVRSRKGDEELDIIRVKRILEDYPVIQKVKSLSDEEIENVITFIKSDKESMLLSDEEMKKIPTKNIFDDFLIKVKGLSHNEADEIVRVRGLVEQPDLSQKIKAWSNPSDDKTVIENTTDVVKDDVWRIKKDEIVKEIFKKKDNFQGKSISEAESEISDIISLNFEIPKNESNALVKDLLSLTCDEYKYSKESQAIDSSDNERFNPNLLKLENDKLRSEIENRNKQIKRMRNLVDSMRRKIEAGAIASGIGKEIGVESSVGKLSEKDTRTLNEELRKKESHIESLKQNITQLNENHDEKVKSLEEQVNELGQKLKKMMGEENQAQNESSDLSLKLKLTEERYEVLNKKYEIVKGQDKEYADQVNQLRNEIREKDQNIAALAEKLTEFSETSSPEQEKLSEEVVEKLKSTENENKALELKYKQIEQKNKFLNEKLRDLEKKLQRTQGGGSSSGGGQNNAAVVKQLETKHDRMKQMYDKVNADLTDRKKELHKLKTESNAMKLRINELEKKLSKHEKNAA